MFEELKKMNAEIEALKKQHLERSKGMFSEVANKLFEKHTVLESFGWRQYTPYFNDGDECTFSAHTSEPNMNGMDSYDDELYCKVNSQNWKGEKYEQFDPALGAAYDDVKEFLANVDDSVLRDLFGDHVQITVTKDGTEVDDYNHD